MSPINAFFWGFIGSAAVEVITIIGYFSHNPPTLPERYRRFGFWVTRIFLAMIAGGLAIAYKIENPVLALNIGAATPLIITSFAKNVQS